MIDLLPCPFCGGTDLGHDWTRTATYIACESCQMLGPEAPIVMPADPHQDDRAEWDRLAAEVWNRRSGPPPMEANKPST